MGPPVISEMTTLTQRPKIVESGVAGAMIQVSNRQNDDAPCNLVQSMILCAAVREIERALATVFGPS